MANWIANMPRNTKRLSCKVANCATAKILGRQVPMNGTLDQRDVVDNEGDDAQAGANSRPEKSAQAQTASPVEHAHLRAHDHVFADLCRDLLADFGEIRAPFAVFAGEGKLLAEVAGLHQGQHQEHEGEDGEADKGIDVPDQGSKEVTSHIASRALRPADRRRRSHAPRASASIRDRWSGSARHDRPTMRARRSGPR